MGGSCGGEDYEFKLLSKFVFVFGVLGAGSFVFCFFRFFVRRCCCCCFFGLVRCFRFSFLGSVFLVGSFVGALV